MPAVVFSVLCLLALGLWLFRGLPLAGAPRETPQREAWIALALSAPPVFVLCGAAWFRPDLLGRGQLKSLLMANPAALGASALALCFCGALGLRLALARPSRFSAELRAGKRTYRCHLGGFEFLYPRSWKMSREGALTYVFAAKPALGVLRVSRVYHDSKLGGVFEGLLGDAGLDSDALALDQARQEEGHPPSPHLSLRPYQAELDEGRWAEAPQALERRIYVVNRGLVIFLFDYVFPAPEGGPGVETPELGAELRALDELLAHLWVSRRVVMAPG